MNIIAEIEGLHLQPIAFPAGWKLIRNMFYAIEPDDDLSFWTSEVEHWHFLVKDRKILYT